MSSAAGAARRSSSIVVDLGRADIRPLAWFSDQSLAPLTVTDPVLVRRRAAEARFHAEVDQLAPRVAVVPWAPPAAALAPLDLLAAPAAAGVQVRS